MLPWDSILSVPSFHVSQEMAGRGCQAWSSRQREVPKALGQSV